MKIIKGISAFMIPALMCLVTVLVSCSSDTGGITYCGPSFIQFADSACIAPVTADKDVFRIPVVMSERHSEDRSIAVKTVVSESNAIEGYHYSVESHNVVIPAGELTGYLELHCSYENIGSVNDSLVATFALLIPDSEKSGLYGDRIRVRLQKVRPFRIEDYAGDMRVTCTFPYSTSAVTRYLVTTEVVDSVTLRIKHPFDDARDMIIRFRHDPENPLKQEIDVPEQIAFTDNTFGPVSMASVDGFPSYYLPEERAFVLYMEAFLAELGSFGAFYYVFQWVSPDHALAEENGLSTLY
ncbi:MAG: DUF4984 domain-containing protein [Bacteroidaceae bacterium]|nr:DUF4984 domain-containing protein [Bacteroidaceae bacterium]